MSILGGLGSLIGIQSSERAKADALRQQALQQAQTQQELTKQIYLDNSNTLGNLGDDLFGQDPEAAAQSIANARAAQAQQLQGSHAVTTPSGRKGTFDFGNAVAQAPSGASGQPTAGGAPTAAPAAAPGQPLQYYNENAGLGNGTEGGYNPYLPSNVQAQIADRPGVQSAPAPAAPTAPANAAITQADRDRANSELKANYGNTLPGQLATSLGNRQSATDAFVNDINGIQRVDPGNYDNAWNVDANKGYISDATKAAQKTAMDKTLALTDTKQTAQEKLMSEMSRRNMEQQLASQKGALDSQLRTRGAYGSGAELAGFLGSQQQLQQQRSLDELGNSANAQQRAMAAIGQYSNQAMQQGQQDTTVGGLQDLNSRFNSTSAQNFQQFKTKTQQQENQDAAKRSASTLDAKNQVENVRRGDIGSIADRKTQIAGLKTGTAVETGKMQGDATSQLAGAFNTAAASADAKGDKDEDLLGGIL